MFICSLSLFLITVDKQAQWNQDQKNITNPFIIRLAESIFSLP